MPDANQGAVWTPPAEITREDIIRTSEDVLARPEMEVRQHEDLFRIREVGLDWDIGAQIYAPADASRIAVGADGKKIGIYLLSGGAGDFKSMEPLALLLAGRFGYKVATMTYPGRLYLQDASRDWPDDTIHADGTVRTPIWLTDELITPDQYDVITDTTLSARYGTRTVAHAKPGTVFRDRMAGWPAAFETAGRETMRRNLPADAYSIYVHGHSTGGPFVFYLSQRVANVAGVLALENSSFGYINEAKVAKTGSLGAIGEFDTGAPTETTRSDPFFELYIRTWRDKARYLGPEALGQDGAAALMRLPSLIEKVMTSWQQSRARPNFKCEYVVTHNISASLAAAARATAERLRLDGDETEALVRRFTGYACPLTGPDAKPVPPTLYCTARDSRDHDPAIYRTVVLPMHAAMIPAPRTDMIRYLAGVHVYTTPEDGLPMGIAPAAAATWDAAIKGGYFVVG